MRIAHLARTHGPQVFRYLLSGGSAAFLELGSYESMLVLGVYYRTAAAVSGIIGLGSAFVFHKYFVFKKKERVMQHTIRYAILQVFNYLAQLYLVTVFVEHVGTGPTLAKVLGIGCAVSWNFFLYKLFVYV